MLKLSDIHMRDPLVVPVAKEKTYYLFGSTDTDCWDGPGVGFNCYKSKNLVDWEGPIRAFTPPKGFWGTKNFWAPEVHAYNGKYYMFASFKAEGVNRGTQILSSEKPEGTYLPLTDKPVTPADWECLDGTLWVEDGEPYIVFCHEWTQIKNGEVCALKLSKDLKKAVGEPVLLFKAKGVPWVIEHMGGYVTDGPFLYKTKTGSLLMLWSSIGKEGYAMGIAVSKNGKVLGPWTHEKTALYGKDGGHGMIFKDFEGQLYFTVHCPNDTPNERPKFIAANEADGMIKIGPKSKV